MQRGYIKKKKLLVLGFFFFKIASYFGGRTDINCINKRDYEAVTVFLNV